MLYTVKLISIFGGILVVLNLLPAIFLPEEVAQTFATVLGYAYQFNHIVDIDSLVKIFFLVMFTEFILLFWRTFKFFLRLAN